MPAGTASMLLDKFAAILSDSSLLAHLTAIMERISG